MAHLAHSLCYNFIVHAVVIYFSVSVLLYVYFFYISPVPYVFLWLLTRYTCWMVITVLTLFVVYLRSSFLFSPSPHPNRWRQMATFPEPSFVWGFFLLKGSFFFLTAVAKCSKGIVGLLSKQLLSIVLTK